MSVHLEKPKDWTHALEMMTAFIQAQTWTGTPREEFHELLDHVSWRLDLFMENTWEEAFGELRSLCERGALTATERMHVELLVHTAMDADPGRYDAQWAPYLRRARREVVLLTRSVEWGRALCSHPWGCGVMVSLRPTPQPPVMRNHLYMNALKEDYGLGAEPALWRKIKCEAAMRALRRVLHRHMAYGTQRMPLERAAQWAERFMLEFDEGAAWYRGRGVLPEEATFEEAIGCVGPRVSGFLLVWDED